MRTVLEVSQVYRTTLLALVVITLVAWGGLIAEEAVGGILDVLGARILLAAAGVAPTCAVVGWVAARVVRAIKDQTDRMEAATATQTELIARGFQMGARSDRAARLDADGRADWGTGPFRAVGNGRAS